ncbi:hypothetical protein LPJ81_000215 [Coemansia sp. IMI 209127]|nr:hypothetical protein LPJ81_000215 [Coemansia sp. IMI 209127]
MTATARSATDLRKHTRRAPSDTVSDIESHGDAPVKRRRESINNGNGSVYAVASGGVSKQSTKYRKITSALSSQFARSLSMSSANGAMGGDSSGNAASISGEETRSTATGAYALLAPNSFIPSSSSSGSSSESPPSRSPMSQTAGFPPEKHGREFRHFMPGRSLKAREKTRAGLRSLPPDDQTLHASDGVHSSMDLDAGCSTPISPNLSSSHVADPDDEGKTSCVFASILQPLQRNIDSEEALHSAVQQWARGQSYDAQTSAMLIDDVDRRISRLKHILPPLLAHTKGAAASNGQNTLELRGEQLQEFYRAGCELAGIGEWLYHRQFPFLLTIFPDLQHELPLLQGIAQISRVAEDMYRLLQSVPELSASLSEMTTQYEGIVRAKRPVYRELLAQDGLTWKAMGLPVDTLLLAQARQWFASVTEQCIVRIARVCECRANSASAYSKEEMTADALNQCSHRVLHAAAQCANLCGNCLPALAPQQLESRALRLAQACEGVLKLLSFTKTILTIDSNLFDAQSLSSDLCIQPAFMALQAMAASLVEMSWTLAEFLAAFRLDGRFVVPSGSIVLFVDVVVRFAKKIVHFGGSKVVSQSYLQRHLRQLQCFLGSLDGSRSNGGVVSAY